MFCCAFCRLQQRQESLVWVRFLGWCHYGQAHLFSRQKGWSLELQLVELVWNDWAEATWYQIEKWLVKSASRWIVVPLRHLVYYFQSGDSSDAPTMMWLLLLLTSKLNRAKLSKKGTEK